MSDDTVRKTLEEKRARRLAEAKTALEEAATLAGELAELAELERLAAKFNYLVIPPDRSPPSASSPLTRAEPKPEGTASVVPTEPQKHRVDDTEKTVADLTNDFRTDQRSRSSLHFRTRKHYDGLLNIIGADYGPTKISEVNQGYVQSMYDEWAKRGIPMAHSLITMFRRLINFGATTLGDGTCERLSLTLHRMRFETAGSRDYQPLTADQIRKIRVHARRMGFNSIALVQALQFETGLRQKDLIGEWVPENEKGDSKITRDGQKWLRGIRWYQIDDDLVLRHTTSKPVKDVTIDLKKAPMVMEELTMLYPGAITTNGVTGQILINRDLLPRTDDPVIVREITGRPWSTVDFRQKWRKVADACGFPTSVKNMDSRPLTGARTNNGTSHQAVESVEIQDAKPASEARH
jgi:hypothetical protein